MVTKGTVKPMRNSDVECVSSSNRSTNFTFTGYK